MTRRLGAALVLLVALAAPAPGVEARPWAWLGVRIRDLSEPEMDEISKRHGIREGFGVVIVEVMESTPAASAGLKSGDIVVALNGRPVTESRLLQRLIAATPTGTDTRLTVLRPAGRRDVRVTLGAMPRDVVGDRVAAEFGFVLREPAAPADPAAALATGTPAVAAVLPGSPSERAGLTVGDVLLQVGERAVLSREAAREALADAAIDRPLRLTVRREGQRLSVVIASPPGPRVP